MHLNNFVNNGEKNLVNLDCALLTQQSKTLLVLVTRGHLMVADAFFRNVIDQV